MKTITIRIKEEMLKEIDRLAEELGIDRSSVIRMLITKGLKEERINRAIKMYINDEVTLERAAEIAGLSILDFLSELKRRGIKHKEDEEINAIIEILKQRNLI